MRRLPPGKVPWDKVAAHVRGDLPPEVLLGPAHGEDAALVRIGGEVWAVASDPITFTSKDAGRLSVFVNANDVAVRGARPVFFTAVVLIAPHEADEESVTAVLDQIGAACRDLGVALIGGHTEVTPELPHTLICGTMLGKVTGRAITTGGLQAGDRIGLTKWAGLEGTHILVEEFGTRFAAAIDPGTLRAVENAAGPDWLSVLHEAEAAAACAGVTSLHDVTEGGVGEALHEMARASGLFIEVDAGAVPTLDATRRICGLFGMDPFGLIGSGAMLVGCQDGDAAEVERVLADRGIPFAWIGRTAKPDGEPACSLPRFERDEILKAWMLEDLEAIVFDMDGTLIDSKYDWTDIRNRLGAHGESIVDDINGYPPAERDAKWKILAGIEQEATRAAGVKEGAAELLAYLKRKGVKTALVTNNTDGNTNYLIEKFGLKFDAVLTRDSGLYKPSGAPIAEAVRRIGASPKRTLCVGDSRYDILAARDAGCARVCLLFDVQKRFSGDADIDFPDIAALRRYLEIRLP